MKFVLVPVLILLLQACSVQHYYVVRHAEKAAANTMTTDVPLTEEGRQRAQALRDSLLPRKIRYIFSTDFIRTRGTAQPLAESTGIPVQVYAVSDTGFVARLKKMSGNVLVVGHSNSVDNLVNGLTGRNLLQDLPETQFGDLFIITRKGNQYTFTRRRFGR